MATKIHLLRLRPSLLRPLLFQKTDHLSGIQHFSSPPPHFQPQTPSFSFHQFPLSFFSRPFSSSPGSANIVHVGSQDGFSKALSKAQEEKLPAIFYFTASWCGPCKMLSPVIEHMSKEFPHVTTYKIDIDQEGLASTLSNLKIYSVPTLHFFHEGKKASEMVGADVKLLKDTMEKLYQ